MLNEDKLETIRDIDSEEGEEDLVQGTLGTLCTYCNCIEIKSIVFATSSITSSTIQ
jgi:hypothetical protein